MREPTSARRLPSMSGCRDDRVRLELVARGGDRASCHGHRARAQDAGSSCGALHRPASPRPGPPRRSAPGSSDYSYIRRRAVPIHAQERRFHNGAFNCSASSKEAAMSSIYVSRARKASRRPRARSGRRSPRMTHPILRLKPPHGSEPCGWCSWRVPTIRRSVGAGPHVENE